MPPISAWCLAATVGAAAALVHAFISITLRGNQYISGLALTIFGLGFSGLIGRSWVGKPLGTPMEFITVPGLSEIPILGPALFTDQYLLTYVGLVHSRAALVHPLLHQAGSGAADRGRVPRRGRRVPASA